MSTTDGPRIGIDLGGTKIEAVLMDPAGQILRRERVPTPRHDYRKTIETLREMVQQFERDLGTPARVGIGTRRSRANRRSIRARTITDCVTRLLNLGKRLAIFKRCGTSATNRALGVTPCLRCRCERYSYLSRAISTPVGHSLLQALQEMHSSMTSDKAGSSSPSSRPRFDKATRRAFARARVVCFSSPVAI